MTEEQKNKLIEIVNSHLPILERVVKTEYNNKWSGELKGVFIETIEKLTWDIENYLLKPTEATPNFNLTNEKLLALPIEPIIPLSRKFKPEDELVRKEINDMIISSNYKQK